jgi:type IV secretory pathway TrbL component
MEHLAIDALSPVHTQYALLSQQWFLTLWTAANWVFNTIVIADIVVFIIARSTVPELFFFIFVERIFYILIFKFILVNAGWLIPSVINGFIEVATRAGSIQALSPQQVAAQGLWLMARMIGADGVDLSAPSMP